MHAPTSRQAQQRLLIPITLLLLLPSVGTILLSANQQARIFSALATANLTAVVIVVLGCLLVADSALIAVSLARFRRTRLITD
jgi:hypothetical protein